MEIIKEANQIISDIIGYQIYNSSLKYRDTHYKQSIIENDVVVLENTMTGEIIALSDEENLNPSMDIKRYLIEHWYKIPEDLSEKSLCHLIRSSYKTKKTPKNKGTINSYVIFTTMECNANCPYCYEKNARKTTMTKTIADDAVKFIINHCGSSTVNLHWFGGEPLVNSSIIDYICQRLEEKSIPYRSNMISNGYLFNNIDMNKVHDLWKLKNIQITLDGTEDEYNKIKAFNNHVNDGFKTVISNMHSLLTADVKIVVRMNQSYSNCENLIELAKYLYEDFQNSITVYSHPLFINSDNPLTADQWEETYAGYIELDKVLKDYKFLGNRGVDTFKAHQCMADSNNAICITAEGNLTMCEHFSDSEIVGNIWDGITNQSLVEEWSELAPEREKCQTCWYYPKCYRLKKCEVTDECFYGADKFYEYQEKQAISVTYRRYLDRKRHDQSEQQMRKEQKFLKVQNVINYAESEVGKTLDVQNYPSEFYGVRQFKGWCLAFIYFIFNKTYPNYMRNIFGINSLPAYVHQLKRFMQQKNRIYNTPKPGDLVFYNRNGWTDHIGLVISISDDGKYFSSIEGNVIVNGVSQVAKIENTPVSSEYIVGFGRPNYTIE